MTAQNMWWMDAENIIPGQSARHFTDTEKKFRDIKTTDSEVIKVIVDKLKSLPHIDAIDAGCGIGGYDLLLFKYLGEKLKLNLLDANPETLESITRFLTRHKIDSFTAQQSAAGVMPYQDNSMDCVCTFDSLHRFNLPRLLSESARVIKKDGYLFIYTRIAEPDGQELQQRTQEHSGAPDNMNALKQSLDEIAALSLETIVFFAYDRMAVMEKVITREKSHNYSTFIPYSPEGMEAMLKPFSVKIQKEQDMHSIHWFDENVLFVIKIVDKPSQDYLRIASGYRPTGWVT